MEWYFASRVKHKDKVQDLSDFLKSHDHEVAYEWSKLGTLKPYHENSEQCSSIANDISSALKGVDVFVLISDQGGTDMFVEMGIAIGCYLHNYKTRIYAIGKFNDRSLMHFNTVIKRVDYLRDVFSMECPELLNKLDSSLLEYFDKM
ncbi:hypothetical protein HN385_04450 [archaeon]|jgi:hypothetical protein|nr:hypothetical protein [archaeon]MBT3582999.1 hypothetical protein [Candidatus Woesearchaeota archaeon]MBT6869682.1 hypothetical protein [archaeon]MBT7193217.1 hypothetical protein [archaeon]MBT7380442.1 hypothetical protein [archaeon]